MTNARHQHHRRLRRRSPSDLGKASSSTFTPAPPSTSSLTTTTTTTSPMTADNTQLRRSATLQELEIIYANEQIETDDNKKRRRNKKQVLTRSFSAADIDLNGSEEDEMEKSAVSLLHNQEDDPKFSRTQVRTTKHQFSTESKQNYLEPLSSVFSNHPSFTASINGGLKQLLQSLLGWNKDSTIYRTEASEQDDDEHGDVIESDSDATLLSSEQSMEKFKASRAMTPLQEKWNALTMIPTVVYCIYFLLSGRWIPSSLVERIVQRNQVTSGSEWELSGKSIASSYYTFTWFGLDEHGCFNSPTAWHNLPALPPFPAVCIAIGICIHAPFSFLYHWKYATRSDALVHWSRRMDQTMIHVASALMSYGTSGNRKYFLFNCFYNIDCCYKQLLDPVVKPKRNQLRIFVSIVLYTLPILKLGEYKLFSEVWAVMIICVWLFGTYPLGGWSHSIFHIVASFSPPILMIAACRTHLAEQQMYIAAQCTVQQNLTL